MRKFLLPTLIATLFMLVGIPAQATVVATMNLTSLGQCGGSAHWRITNPNPDPQAYTLALAGGGASVSGIAAPGQTVIVLGTHPATAILTTTATGSQKTKASGPQNACPPVPVTGAVVVEAPAPLPWASAAGTELVAVRVIRDLWPAYEHSAQYQVSVGGTIAKTGIVGLGGDMSLNTGTQCFAPAGRAVLSDGTTREIFLPTEVTVGGAVVYRAYAYLVGGGDGACEYRMALAFSNPAVVEWRPAYGAQLWVVSLQ